jgi:sialate O-acetylesterase
VIVSNKNIKSPVAVRFAFNNTDTPNLFNKEGLPVNLFRTDNWEMDTSAIKK